MCPPAYTVPGTDITGTTTILPLRRTAHAGSADYACPA
jgi:hypothetical protein